MANQMQDRFIEAAFSVALDNRPKLDLGQWGLILRSLETEARRIKCLLSAIDLSPNRDKYPGLVAAYGSHLDEIQVLITLVEQIRDKC